MSISISVPPLAGVKEGTG